MSSAIIKNWQETDISLQGTTAKSEKYGTLLATSVFKVTAE